MSEQPVQRYADTSAEMWRKVFVEQRRKAFRDALLSAPSPAVMFYGMPPMTEAEKSYSRRVCTAMIQHLDAGGRI